MSDKIIQQLADRFGTTVEHLWAVMVRQAQITAMVDALIAALCLVSMIVIFCVLRRGYTMLRDHGDDYDYKRRCDDATISSMFALLLLVFALPGFFLSAQSTATKIFNPEYWALQQVLSALK